MTPTKSDKATMIEEMLQKCLDQLHELQLKMDLQHLSITQEFQTFKEQVQLTTLNSPFPNPMLLRLLESAYYNTTTENVDELDGRSKQVLEDSCTDRWVDVIKLVVEQPSFPEWNGPALNDILLISNSNHPCKTKMSLLPMILTLTLFQSLTQTLEMPLVAPILKDESTQLYTLSLFLKSPLQPTKLHLHLGSSLTWVLCDSNYSSSTYHHIPCDSLLCNSFSSHACSSCFQPPSPNCANDTCALFPENPITRNTLLQTAIIDSLALPTYDATSLVSISDFIFSCATPHLLQGLASNAAGLAALGRSNHSLPAQISSALTSPHSLALCLPSSPSITGAAIFASTSSAIPNFFSSKIYLLYTQLILNPVPDTVITDNSQPSHDYFINLTSIQINGKPLPINASILTVDQNGFGGTKITTAEPYTVLETSIYKLFLQHFVNESSAFNLTVTEAVEPFGVCYPAGDLSETRVGPAVPTVDLVMHSQDVFWRIFGGNSMVRISKGGVDVWCLGFVDGGSGSRRRTAVEIGGHQLEDNLVHFDIDSNRFGFTSSLLLQAANCAHLNVTNRIK
ncbi:hypothetical protein VNO78_17303 [Psophocarpus tetragonolobus]|uniref:Peptidase A1 domain-containing protein n=1 Tax=Psophocarpus tetragonolobus TaxID=3891 RepID=A0AAN9SH78_PSOTE